MNMDKIKSLDAKVQIHRLATTLKETYDMPFKSKEEKEKEEDILEEIRIISNNVILKNDVDKKDFEDFLEQQIGMNDIDVIDAEGETIDDEQLTDVIDLPKGEAIPSIKAIQQKQKSIKEQIKELQDRKNDLKLLKQKDNLQKEIQKMEQTIAEEQKETHYLTDLKNKDGLVKLRHDTYNRRMDDLKVERIRMDQMMLEELAKKTPDDETIKIIKEAIKINKQKVNRMRTVKIQTYVQNYMVKIPKWIASGSKQISELSGSMANMGNDLNEKGGGGGFDKGSGKGKGKSKGENFSALQVGGDDDSSFGFGDSKGGNDFGFNQNSMFGGERKEKSESEPKKRKKKRKSKKK